jgi:hypothetical protein
MMRLQHKFAAAAVMALTCVCGIARAAPAEKIALKILYMGQPDTPRAKDFTKFLEEHFAQVAVMDVAKFQASQTAPYDVVILDANPRARDLGTLAKLKLPSDYSKPTVLQGIFGARVGTALDLRLGFS